MPDTQVGDDTLGCGWRHFGLRCGFSPRCTTISSRMLGCYPGEAEGSVDADPFAHAPADDWYLLDPSPFGNYHLKTRKIPFPITRIPDRRTRGVEVRRRDRVNLLGRVRRGLARDLSSFAYSMDEWLTRSGRICRATASTKRSFKKQTSIKERL